MNFVAIDFETADHGRDSACAVALVRVEDGRIADRACHLIRPPRREFVFSFIHGITWTDVAGEPTFREVWPRLTRLLTGAQFLAAHNAPFDEGVLHACCAAAGLRPPRQGFECTVRLARAVWGIYPTKLPDVCRRLRIPLRHHDAASDAEACARIVIAAAGDTGGAVTTCSSATAGAARRRAARRAAD
ncbi:MAG TPA: 3'-5' exonuclease [Candidatus Dormibacteraeota bacterium]|nr:3'-5' exonuclease [Candidatus Dormibacteraeota bacterium]